MGLGIDQSKIKERNHQVNLMDHIYSLATSVRICVQDPIARSSGMDYSPVFRRFGQTKSHEPAAVHHHLLPYDHVSLIMQLLTRRYFKRIWVIQEVVLARAAYLALNDEELLLTSAVLEGMMSICTYQLGGGGRPPPSILSWRANQDKASSILSCLYASMNCEMTDPRDGVYAVLSLMEPRSRSLISVNYASTVESVYANAIAANISTHQDLAILSYVGVGTSTHQASAISLYIGDGTSTSPEGNTSSSPATSAGGWQTAMCLDMARLRLFVLDNCGSKSHDPVPRIIPKPFPPQFGTHSMGAWRPTMDIGVASPEDYSREITSGSHVCLVELPRPTHTDFLPRIRIQAHYIDSVDQTAFNFRWGEYLWNIAYHVLSEPSCLKLVDFSWLAALLGGSPETSSGVLDKDWYKYQDRCVHPLETWLLMAEEANLSIAGPNLTEIWTFFNRTYLVEGQIFLSHFSVGCVQTSIQTGDEIFAVDGVGSPLVLRKTGVNQYRIVTECWLLAALELDCWNPGTKKGRWGEDVERPTETQTRMIEIY